MTQILGEQIDYRVDVSGDKITSITWSVTPTGATFTQVEVDIDHGIARFVPAAQGDHVLKAVILMETGQIRIWREIVSVIN